VFGSTFPFTHASCLPLDDVAKNDLVGTLSVLKRKGIELTLIVMAKMMVNPTDFENILACFCTGLVDWVDFSQRADALVIFLDHVGV